MDSAQAVAYAGFWRRVLAALVDALFFAVLAGGLLGLWYGGDYVRSLIMPGEPDVDTGSATLFIEHLLSAAVTLAMWRRFGATPGKFLMGCRVVDAASLGSLSWAQTLLRYVGYLASILPLGLGFVWVAFDKRKQGFHDKLARTVVIMEDEAAKTLAQLQREAGLS
jgi:uncharacterized RDD family membrane protein YckC